MLASVRRVSGVTASLLSVSCTVLQEKCTPLNQIWSRKTSIPRGSLIVCFFQCVPHSRISSTWALLNTLHLGSWSPYLCLDSILDCPCRAGEGKSTGGQRGGERGGNDRDRERADLRGNHLAAHGRIPLHESSMPIEQQQQPRARLRKQAPTGLVVLATAPGAMPDNRDQVIARAREMERQRRLEGRTTCYTSEPVPEIHGVTVASPAADLVGQFKDISRRKLDGSSDEVDMMVGWGPAPPRGVVDADSCWPLPRVVGRRSSSGGDRSDTRSDRSDSGGGRTPTDDGNGTPTASLTGAVSSVARSDGDGWGVISSSVSPSPSSSSSCGEGSIRGSRGSRGGRRGSSCWGEGTICESAAICSASVSAMSGSATGSASGSASGDVDGDRSLSGEEPPWCEELASSIGVVTDLVLPSPMSRAGGFGPPRRGRGYMKESRWGVDVGGDDDDDEEEREMDAALEVRPAGGLCENGTGEVIAVKGGVSVSKDGSSTEFGLLIISPEKCRRSHLSVKVLFLCSFHLCEHQPSRDLWLLPRASVLVDTPALND